MTKKKKTADIKLFVYPSTDVITIKTISGYQQKRLKQFIDRKKKAKKVVPSRTLTFPQN